MKINNSVLLKTPEASSILLQQNNSLQETLPSSLENSSTAISDVIVNNTEIQLALVKLSEFV